MQESIMRHCSRLALAVLVTAGCLTAPALRAAENPGQTTARVRIASVEVAVSAAGPVVLLKAEARAIPVFVDPTVAESIHSALNKRSLPRTLSHELMHSILQSYGGRVTEVMVTLQGTTYHGALSIDVGGDTKVFDSRSSDAIAMALHFAAPIFVSRELLEKAGQALPEPPGSRRL